RGGGRRWAAARALPLSAGDLFPLEPTRAARRSVTIVAHPCRARETRGAAAQLTKPNYCFDSFCLSGLNGSVATAVHLSRCRLSKAAKLTQSFLINPISSSVASPRRDFASSSDIPSCLPKTID